MALRLPALADWAYQLVARLASAGTPRPFSYSVPSRGLAAASPARAAFCRPRTASGSPAATPSPWAYFRPRTRAALASPAFALVVRRSIGVPPAEGLAPLEAWGGVADAVCCGAGRGAWPAAPGRGVEASGVAEGETGFAVPSG